MDNLREINEAIRAADDALVYLHRAAEYLDRLCHGLCQLGLTLII